MKEIIILGGGFAGVSAALTLSKQLRTDEANITLIDKNTYHLFHPSLYEVATNEQPKKSIAIPFSEIFANRVKTVKGEVKKIDIENHRVLIEDDANCHFDYLIITLGSEASYYGVKGLAENSISLKTLEDAVKIRETIESVYHKKAKNGEQVIVVVGGGGFSGTELTAELINYRTMLAREHSLLQNLMKIKIIQGSSTLLAELDEKVSQIAQKRLEKNGVEICLGEHIVKVTDGVLETDVEKKHKFDVLVWTGGVRANSILENCGFKLNGRGQVTVNDKMQISDLQNIFAAGDIAEFADPITNKPVPNVAEVAMDQGRTAAVNTVKIIRKQNLTPYKYKHLGYVIPLKGRFAVAELKRLRIVGFMGWVLQQLIFLKYLVSILPVSKALRRWNKFEMYLMR